jgi:hypothetical protein
VRVNWAGRYKKNKLFLEAQISASSIVLIKKVWLEMDCYISTQKRRD